MGISKMIDGPGAAFAHRSAMKNIVFYQKSFTLLLIVTCL